MNAIAKTKTKKDSSSLMDKLNDFFRTELKDTNQVDKIKFDSLKKSAWDKFQIKRGSQHYAKNSLNNILKEKGIVVDGLKQSATKGQVGNLQMDVIGETAQKVEAMVTGQTPVQPQSPTMPQSSPNQTERNGIFGNQPTQPNQNQPSQPEATPQDAPKPPLDPARKEQYAQLFEKTLMLPANVLIQFGFIEGEDADKEEKPKSFKDQIKEYSHWIADFCFRNNIEIPLMLEAVGIGIAGMVLFGAPIAKKYMGMKKSKRKTSEDEGNLLAKASERKEETKS